MAKVTSKLQVTVPKDVAARLGIGPGDDIEWRVEGASARVARSRPAHARSKADRLEIFDEATARQDERNRAWRAAHRTSKPHDRGWTRDDLYTRGRAR